MKAIVLLILVASAFATKTSTQSQIKALLQGGTKANDAIQTIYDILNDLIQSSEDAQANADKRNISHESNSANTVSDFTEVLSINQHLLSEVQETQEFYQSELSQCESYLSWNVGRTEEIERKTAVFQENQCYSNHLFVRALGMHSNALDLLAFLKNDLNGYVGGEVEDIQLMQFKAKSAADKIKSYSAIFNTQEINTFLELAHGGNGPKAASKLLQVVTDLLDRVQESIDDLRENEINAAYQLSSFLASAEAEAYFLNEEANKEQLLVDRIRTQINSGVAQQANIQATLMESQQALAQAIDEIENKRQDYHVVSQRRVQDKVIFRQISSILKEQVASYSLRF